MILLYYVIVLFILLALLASFKPIIKGYFGEKKVSSRLDRLSKSEYKILNDVLLNTKQGTSQIDHVVISCYGIFVIETKNYKGWITGSEHGAMWVQNIYGKKASFQNPIHQNYSHIKALEQYVGKQHFFSIVAFSNEAEIKVKLQNEAVVSIDHMVHHIQTLSKERRYTKEEVNEMCAVIEQHRLKEKKDKKAHVAATRLKSET